MHGDARQQALSSAERVRLSAQLAWEAMERIDLPHSPRNYELLHAFFSDGNPQLTEILGPCLAPDGALTDERAGEIYEALFANGNLDDRVLDGAGRLAEAAGGLVDRISGNRSALAGYGSVLAHWAGRLQTRATVDDLMKAIVALLSETEQAEARNRVLEEQLSAAATDIARLRGDLVEMQHAAATDGLTGLANRKSFDGHLRQAMAQVHADPGSTFSLLILDIDHFKGLNDQHGHRFGDQVLRLVGRLLKEKVNDRDLAARYGGEEFVIVLGQAGIAAGVDLALEICHRLRSQRLVKRGSGEVVGQVTISVGVAQYRPGESAHDLVERADRALYEAKRTGRDRVCPTRQAAAA